MYKDEQEVLQQQAKMAAMGEMIGNIAHQWRQPLNSLSALNVLLGIKYKRGELSEEEMEKFQKKSNELIQSMSDTIDDFKNFFRPDKTKERFSVNEAIHNAIRFVSDSYLAHKIQIIFKEQSFIEVNSYKNELIQVLLNILNNSKDALVEHSIANPKVVISMLELENEVIIEIQDNGGGVDETISDRIYEPYFTTKFKSEGTGIGLYMSKMIIERSMNGLLMSKNRGDGFLTIIRIGKEVDDWSYAI